MGKKLLYLDLDLIERIEKALEGVPGRPSVSALVNEVLPQVAEMAEAMQKVHSSVGLAEMLDIVTGLKVGVEEKYADLYREVKERSTTKEEEKPQE